MNAASAHASSSATLTEVVIGNAPSETALLDDVVMKDPSSSIVAVEPALLVTSVVAPLEISSVPLVDPLVPKKTRNNMTGYVYDTRMLSHWPLVHPQDDEDSNEHSPHPEQPQRISAIFAALCQSLCISDMVKLPIRPMEKHEAMLIHSLDHWEKVMAIALMDDESIQNSEDYYERLSLYVHATTPTVACLSGGGVIETCLAVARGEVKNAFAIVRPPGHHAEPDEHMGFCFFNNVAIAARVVQEETPLKKILILDWDVHHGNGTQRAFWADDSILYISIHRYDGGNFYPHGPFGSVEACGEGKGLGKSVNIPWPCKGMGDADYLYAFLHIVMPIAYEFAPEMVIISAGFDAAEGDELGQCLVTPAGFAHMTHMLCSLAGGKVAAALEGGYNIDAISSSALAVTKVLLGEAPPEIPSMVASEIATEVVWHVAMQQSVHWTCIKPKALEPRDEDDAPTMSVAELLRQYRAQLLFEKYRMYQMPFVDERLQARFEGQMICSSNVYSARDTLLFLVHDLCNLRVELDGKPYCNVNMEKSRLEDATQQVIKWALSDPEKGLVDLNVHPNLISADDNYGETTYEQAVADLICYVWDNYIELSEAKHIIMICHGTGCGGVMRLLRSRDVKSSRVKALVHLVPFGVPPKVPLNTSELWYREHAAVVLPEHSGLSEYTARVRRRYGKPYFVESKTSFDMLTKALPHIEEFAFVQSHS